MMAVALLTSCKFDVTKTVTVKSTAEEPRFLKGFERIQLMGSMNVKYAQADSFSVRVHAPQDVIKKIETTVEGNTLKVSTKRGTSIIHIGSVDSDDVIVYVTSPDFLGISLMGSGDFMCVHPLDTDTLDIELKGSGDIYFKDIICDRVNVSLVGSGDVSVNNVKTQQASLSLIGSGDIDLPEVEAKETSAVLVGSGDIKMGLSKVADTHLSLKGSGDIKVDFSEGCRSVDCTVNGSGDIGLSGKIGHFRGEKHGSGDIDIANLTIEK
jgi:hypothetical protein